MTQHNTLRKHKLITKEIERKLPPLYVTENTPAAEKVAVVKFFNPYTGWRWYITEGERQDDGDLLMFGYVNGFEGEWGYVSLNELEAATVAGRVPAVERDKYFEPQAMGPILSGDTY